MKTPNTDIFNKGMEILKDLETKGEAYVVGGAVRDMMLGKNPKDIDIATNVPMGVVEENYKTFDIGKNKDFGIVVVKHSGEDFEVAQFRSESDYTDGRHPDVVKLGVSFLKDTERRDFTINAMGLTSELKVIDYHGGILDLDKKIIRTVGDPELRFGEDYLRMLRAVRFASRLKFSIEEKTFAAIQNNAHKIKLIAAERVLDEIMKMADDTGVNFAKGLELLKSSKLLEQIFPDIDKMSQFEHNVEYHPEGGVWEHVLAGIRSNVKKDPILNLAILFHDIGKVRVYSFEDGKHKYNSHEKVSVELIHELAAQYKFDNNMRDGLAFAAQNHMKMHKFKEISDSKVMTLIEGKYWPLLFDLAKCDDLSRGLGHGEKWNDVLNKVDLIAEKRKKIKSLAKIKQAANGLKIMKLIGIEKPCKEVGDIQKYVIDKIINVGIDITDDKHIECLIFEARERLKCCNI